MGTLFLPPSKNPFGEHQLQQHGTAPLHSNNKTGHCSIEFKLAALIQGECVVAPRYKEVIDAKPYHKVIPRFHFSTDDSKTSRTRF